MGWVGIVQYYLCGGFQWCIVWVQGMNSTCCWWWWFCGGRCCCVWCAIYMQYTCSTSPARVRQQCRSSCTIQTLVGHLLQASPSQTKYAAYVSTCIYPHIMVLCLQPHACTFILGFSTIVHIATVQTTPSCTQTHTHKHTHTYTHKHTHTNSMLHGWSSSTPNSSAPIPLLLGIWLAYSQD